MLITKSRENCAPIKIEQCTLNKFCPTLPEMENHGLLAELDRRIELSANNEYTLEMRRNGTIYMKEMHCRTCGSRLVKNGWNKRIAVLDHGLGRHEFQLERKRCPRCGEIKPDYSKIAPKYGMYHENYKRRARQHYMEGLMPSQIQQVFQIDFGIKISLTTLVNWINKIAEPLRKTLKETPVPSSGYWGYDEIHLRISKERMYAIDTVDLNTRFVPVARISRSMGRNEGRKVLMEGRRGKSMWIQGLMKDCTANLGGLFRTRSFKHIIQQNCLTHVKWIVSKHVKAFAGLSKQSKKPVPEQWQWLLKRFYDLIDSKDETDAYIKLEIIRNTVERLRGKKVKELHSAISQLEGWFPKLIAHQRNPFIPSTNNLLEGFHKKYTYYPSFKRNMRTPVGAQRVLDFRVFKHNFGRFPQFISRLNEKYDQYRLLVRETQNHPSIRGGGMHFKHVRMNVNGWFENYQQLWTQYFAKI